MAQVTSGAFKTYQDSNFDIANIGSLIAANLANLMVGLYTSASNANDLTISALLATLTNEVANGNGYTTGGVALANAALTQTDNTWSLAFDDFTEAAPLLEASGADIVFRFAVIYFNGTVGGKTNPLLGVFLADPTPADVTVADGQKLTLTVPTGGILIGTGAATD